MTDVVGLDEWVYVDADRTMTALDFDEIVELTCNTEPSACRTSCVVPDCGDGFLDPGEECDDANVFDGDDCPSDCDL
jgi:cysteine-rich repeat protein